MPQLQVIQREQQENPFQASTNAMVDSIKFAKELDYKKSLLDYQLKQLKVQERGAVSEEQKIGLARKAQAVEKFKTILDIAQTIKDPEMKKKFLTTYTSKAVASGDLDEVFGDPTMLEGLGMTQPPAKDQYQQAMADVLKNQPGIGVDGQVMPMNQGNNAAPSSRSPWLVTDMGPSGPSLTNVTNTANVVRAKKLAEGAAAREVEMAPLKETYGRLKQTFYKAVDEMGGLGNTALGAKLKGMTANVGAELGNMPATQALNRELDSFAISIASLINRGRPTDKDQAAAAKTLFSNKYPLATNLYLMDYIESVFSSGDKGAIDDMYKKVFVGTDAKGNRLDPKVHNEFVSSLNKQAEVDRKNITNLMSKGGLSQQQAEEYLYDYKKRTSGGNAF